ncbi:hypothetical protein L596_029270 [Steinernema carpocapsae]|uniref:Uncharacterized protein n=1 Tax=Steinernema carpocapsae TaxID=34508 RepID=A0A4U5LU53_STECR|nr:hypothetical protein L596_029270 [Steinernema carpocapsae]
MAFVVFQADILVICLEQQSVAEVEGEGVHGDEAREQRSRRVMIRNALNGRLDPKRCKEAPQAPYSDQGCAKFRFAFRIFAKFLG